MQYFYLREKENQGGLCCSLPLVRFLRIKPCSGLRADTFRCCVRQLPGLSGRFAGHKTYILAPRTRLSVGSYRHSFSDVDHIPNSRFNHTAITGSGIIA